MSVMMAMMGAKMAFDTIGKYQQLESAKQSLLQSAIADGVKAYETEERFKINSELMRQRGLSLASRQASAYAKGGVSVSEGVGFQTQVQSINLMYQAISRKKREMDFDVYQLNKSKNAKYGKIQSLNEAQFLAIVSGGLAAAGEIAGESGGSKESKDKTRSIRGRDGTVYEFGEGERLGAPIRSYGGASYA